MFLRRVKLRHYRGIHELDLQLAATVVCIGENGCGKTSLLDALELVFGPQSPAGRQCSIEDFHIDADDRRTEALSLEFFWGWYAAEMEQCPAALRQVLVPDARDGAVLHLRLRATRQDDDVSTELFVCDAEGGYQPDADATEIFNQVAALRPVVRFGSGTGMPLSACPLPDDPAQLERLLAESRLATVHELLRGRRKVDKELMEQAVAAAQQLVARYLHRSEPSAPRRQRRTIDIVEAPQALRQLQDLREVLDDSNDSERLRVILLLFGGLLQARGCEVLHDDARPLWLFDDPETHLHSIALATLWSFVEQIPGPKLVTTNSGTLLNAFPLRAIRRLSRTAQGVAVHRIKRRDFDTGELRRLAFHVRVQRPDMMFARCWLLVEGETEFWLLPELARVMGWHLPSMGVACVDFAQAGLSLLVRCAQSLGINWHVVADGDRAGQRYADIARSFVRDGDIARHVTLFPGRDIEGYLWDEGFEDVYREVAGTHEPRRGRHASRQSNKPRRVIERAIKKVPKPELALMVAAAAGERGEQSVPEMLRGCLQAVYDLSQ